MSQPLVSIVIPTYNQRAEFLRASVKSALNQTYPDIEVVVSDNHSTNDVPQVLAEFSDPRLRIVHPPKHLGMVDHFVFAGDQARGEYMSFLSSDDLLYPDWLESLLPMLVAHPDVSFGFGEIENVPHDAPEHVNYLYREGKLPSGIYSVAHMLPIMMRLNRASGWMVGELIRTSAYRQAGGIGRDNLRYSADYSLAFRLLELTNDVAYLNKPVAKNRSWGAQDGKVDAVRMRDAVADIADIYSLLEDSRPLKAVVEQLAPVLTQARRDKARVLALGLLAAIAAGEISPELIAGTRADILAIGASGSTRLLLLLCRQSLSPVLRLLYRPAITLARSPAGRKLLRL